MTRYEIALGKTPPLVILAESTIYEHIRKTILAGKLPFEVDDVVITPNAMDPDWIDIKVLARSTHINSIDFRINVAPQSASIDFHTPALGSNLHGYLESQFFEISTVAIPPDPMSQVLSIENNTKNSNYTYHVDLSSANDESHFMTFEQMMGHLKAGDNVTLRGD